MQWYYVKDKQQQGPLDTSEFKALFSSGQIDEQTLVWNQNMTDWQPLGLVKDQVQADGEAGNTPQAVDIPAQTVQPSETSVESVQSSETSAEPAVGSGEYKRLCSECGRAFSDDELVSYHGKYICAGCKPVFLQKLREGVATTGTMAYAGFWIRFVAAVIDGLILGVFNFVLSMVAGVLSAVVGADGSNQGAAIAIGLISMVLYLGFYLFYEIWFVGKYAATPGKMAIGLKVVTPENTKVSYKRATGRFFAKILSGMIIYVGYIMAGFDDEKRSLHDRICATRVIKK